MAENNKALISEVRADLAVEDEILSVTVLGKSLRLVCAVEKLSIEKLQFTAFTQLFRLFYLHSDDSKDELKEEVDDQNVEHVLQRINDAIEYSLGWGLLCNCSIHSKPYLQLRNSLDCLERSQHSKHSQRFDRV